ncbi:MAG: alpha/beta fold hydrolase [Candidatus Nomurabacteria bacterium]|nr:alpha/beta fold hydrolase [Candidatus Nomurabacteria bacterium]USN87419.1 MAG: alpha/beta fold hydrolase [Candidatus Nomurabacteria bacterium]
MKKQVLYIHGGDSYSKHEDFLQALRTMPIRNLPGAETKSFWPATLAEDLGDDFEVFSPSMPNKQNARYEEWKIWFERHLEFIRDEVTLVGWSLGGVFLAKYLSENKFPHKIKSLYILGAPSGEVKPHSSGEDCASFLFNMDKLSDLSQQVKEVNIWHSKDDFVVPYEEFLNYRNHLEEANLVSFEDKNHFLLTEFPELVEGIRSKY